MKPVLPLPAVACAALLAALAAGCATEDTKAPATEAQSSRRVDAITGSHIANKTPLPPQSDIEREKTVERMKELQKTSQPVQTKPN